MDARSASDGSTFPVTFSYYRSYVYTLSMKLLIATGLYPPDIGGPATYSKIIHDELTARGHAVRVVSFGSVRSFPKGIRHVFYFSNLLVRAIGVDTIYAQDPVSVGLPAMVAAKILRKKFVVKIVGDYAWEQGVLRFGISEPLDEFSKKKNTYPAFIKMLKKIETYVTNSAHKIIVPSAYLKTIVSNWGVQPEKISIIYNSFTPPKEIPDEEEKNNEILIVSAGRLVPWKGFQELVSFIPNIVALNENIRLVIAGDGPLREELVQQINNNMLNRYVRLVGKLSQDELYKLILRSKVFVFNTKYEGLSHQLLEVMYLKTPIITTAIGGNTELIENNVSGVLVEPDNKEEIVSAIQKIISDESFAKQISEQAFLKTKEFTREKMVNGLIHELT